MGSISKLTKFCNLRLANKLISCNILKIDNNNVKKNLIFKKVLSKCALMNINKAKKNCYFNLNSKIETDNENRYLNDVVKFDFIHS